MKVLGERFEIVEPLGIGSMGEVYRVRDRARGQDVALKMLPDLDATALVRFKNEFRTLHDVEHPNVVRVHELYESHGTWFFTMQLIDGVDALTWIGHDEQRLRAVLPQLACALHRLHAEGLVHRDIKASNVLVTPAGNAKLLDFGLVAPTWAHGDGVGTPSYMAPEQIEGDVGPAADWYAVGVLMFRALTGRFPFVGSPDEVAAAKCSSPAPRVTALAPDAPPDLAALADALLARQPRDRPAGERVIALLGGRREPARVAHSLLVGRSHELACLDEAVADRIAGATLAVSVTGESGIGKTALLRAFAADLEARGIAWAISGRCWERESVPYKGLDGVIDELAARLDAAGWSAPASRWAPILAQAFPALRRVDAFASQPAFGEIAGHETVARVSGAVRWLLSEVARDQPLVVVLDDVQWADRDTIAVVHALVEPPLANVLLVVGARDAVVIGEQATVRTIALAPLSPAETAELVEIVARDLGGTLEASAIAREAAGHPLLATELARHAVSTGRTGAISFDAAVCQLADRGGTAARQLATAISLASTPLALDAAARAAELSPTACFEAIEALRRVKLVASTGVAAAARLEPSHDRIRRALTAHLDDAMRTQLHGRLAGALVTTGSTDDAAIAQHFQLAGEPVLAADHALRAAEVAEAALAFHQAARLYAWVRELDPTRASIRVRHAECLAQAGLGARAADVFLECAQETTGPERIDLRRRAMQQLLLMGHCDRALALFDELTTELAVPNPKSERAMIAGLVRHRLAVRLRRTELPPVAVTTPPPLERARLDVIWDAAAGLALLDPLRAFYLHSLNLDLCFASGDSSRLARALMGEAPYLATSGRRTRRLERVIGLADEAAERAAFPALSPLARGTVAFFCGDWTTCDVQLARCEKLLAQDRPRLVREGFGPAQLQDLTRRLHHVAVVYLGRLDEMRRTIPDLLRDAIERNDVTAATHLRSGVQALVHLAADDVDTALRHADEGIAPWRTARVGIPQFMDAQARAIVALYRDDAAAAHAALVEQWPAFSRARVFRARYVLVSLLDLRGKAAIAAALTAPTPRERRRLVADAQWCAHQLARAPGRWPQPLRDVIVAGVAQAERDSATARTALARAATGFAAQSMTLHATCAERAAAHLRGDAQHVELTNRTIAAAGVTDVARFARVLVPLAT